MPNNTTSAADQPEAVKRAFMEEGSAMPDYVAAGSSAQPAAPQGVAYAELPALFREALAWGMTYGPAIPAHQWDEMRESMVKVYTKRASHGQAPATQQAGEVVAYLDIGAGGYLDLGAALSDEALQQLPKGRHALVIAGTYGIDGYVAAPQPSPTAQAALAALARVAPRPVTAAEHEVLMAAVRDNMTLVAKGRLVESPEEQVAPTAGAAAGPDGRMSHELRRVIEGMSVSVDVSTGDHDAGHRYFGTVTEVMDCNGDKHGVTLLVQDAEPNFAPTPAAQADSQPAPVLGYPPLPHELTRTDRGHLIQRFRVEALMRAYVDADRAARAQADSVLEDADPIRALIAQHAAILDQNESAYFELCYHRVTGWMAWITDKPLCMPPVVNQDRKVLAHGQGDTADEACADAARKQGGA